MLNGVDTVCDPSSGRTFLTFQVAGERRVFIFRSSGGPHDPDQHRPHRNTLERQTHSFKLAHNTSAERVAQSARCRSPQTVRLSQTIRPWCSTVQRDSEGDK